MTQLIKLLFCISLSFLFSTVGYAQQQDSVTISGRVTDFNGQLTDLENGDRGEGLYYMEKENYIK